MKALDIAIVGRRVRSCREQLGYTREQFSEQVSISPQFLAEIENGKKGMSAETLYKICTRFSISADYLLLGVSSSNTLDDPIQTMLSTFSDKYIAMTEDIIRAIEKTAAIDS